MFTVSVDHDTISVEDLGGLLDAVPDAVLALAGDGEVLFANAKARDLFSDLDFSFEIPAMGLGRTDVVEVVIERRGETRRAEMQQELAMLRGEEVHVVTLRDVTEQRQLEARLQQNERLALIGRIAAEVAHEINNPAAFIRVNLELLREALPVGSSLAEEIDPLAVDSLRGVDRVAAIVEDLRRFARVGSDDVESVEVSTVVRDACKLLVTNVRAGADVVTELEALPTIPGRRGRLLQVVTNLVVNALHAVETLPYEERRVRVATTAEAACVRLKVEDNGIGMTEEVQRRAFDPFFTTKGAERGTGLGLAMCAEIVKSHRGQIRVHSEVGKGTRIEVELPFENGLKPAERGAAPSTPEIRPAVFNRLRALVVDDEPTLLVGFAKALARQFDVDVAEDGLAALDKIRSGVEYDVVVCDLTMPRLDGPGLYQQVCDEHPEYASRFIIATGAALTEKTAEFIRRDGLEVLHKPFGLADLREAASRIALRGREPTLEPEQFVRLIRGEATG